ncbi:MAG TPA: hypothetical protein GXX29_08255 [Firmicutes bacterium]|nr:hypothetical protein [Bacillota bacterium]
MIPVAGVRFKRAGKIYHFDAGEIPAEVGQNVIVETAKGLELGEVIEAVKPVPEEEITTPLKKIIRIATEEDLEQQRKNRLDERDAFGICQQFIAERGLEMKLVDVEYSFDRSRLLFYFTAEKRVDFRELVKDLAVCFRTRIELRQIGVRDEAKILGGLGVCGRTLCCHLWMNEFAPVSIRQAKDQDLAMNPNKISGICGRLKCCLRFESDTYEDARAHLPKVGERLLTPSGEGKVVAVNYLGESVTVEIGDGKTCTLSGVELCECLERQAALEAAQTARTAEGEQDEQMLQELPLDLEGAWDQEGQETPAKLAAPAAQTAHAAPAVHVADQHAATTANGEGEEAGAETGQPEQNDKALKGHKKPHHRSARAKNAKHNHNKMNKKNGGTPPAGKARNHQPAQAGAQPQGPQAGNGGKENSGKEKHKQLKRRRPKNKTAPPRSQEQPREQPEEQPYKQPHEQGR